MRRLSMGSLAALCLVLAATAVAQDNTGQTPSGPTQPLTTTPVAEPVPLADEGPVQLSPGTFPGDATTTQPGQADPGAPIQIEPPSAFSGGVTGPCPTDVLGTSVTVEETGDGFALSFTNSNGRAAEVQERVDAMSQSTQFGGTTRGVDVSTQVQNTANGARIVLTPTAGIDRNLLRDRLEVVASGLQAGACPLVPSTGGGNTAQTPSTSQTDMDRAGQLDVPNQPGQVDPSVLDPMRDNEPIRPAGQTPLSPDGSDPAPAPTP